MYRLLFFIFKLLLKPYKMIRNLLFLYGLILFLAGLPSVTNAQTRFAESWAYMGIAVEDKGFTIWGSSPILDDAGKVHLFVARWPSALKVDPGWRSHSEIAHYVADTPEGPFRFSEVALTGTGKDTWDKFGAHNPAIHQIGDKYYLFYIGNTNPEQPPHPANQCIGLAVSESLNGPWEAASNTLPNDFAAIPDDHPSSEVLASVPGTPAVFLPPLFLSEQCLAGPWGTSSASGSPLL